MNVKLNGESVTYRGDPEKVYADPATGLNNKRTYIDLPSVRGGWEPDTFSIDGKRRSALPMINYKWRKKRNI